MSNNNESAIPGAEVIERVTRQHLGPGDAEAFLGLIRPGTMLRSDGSGRSRLGGPALLPAGHGWPEWEGRPLSLLAVIDLAELADHPSDLDLPSSGTLSIFFDVDDQPWGYDPRHAGGSRVVFCPTDVGAVAETPSGLREFAPMPLGAARSATAPDFFEVDLDALRARCPEALEVLYDELDDVLFATSGPRHQVGGWPALVQNPIWQECQLASNGVNVGGPEVTSPLVDSLLAEAPTWQLLVQIDTDDRMGWNWGDDGRLYVAIRRQDLAARRFDRCWTVLQCY